MTDFSEATTIKRKDKNILITTLGNEMVMMDIDNGSYITLNNIGRVIWEKIENPVSVSDLIAYLLSKYNVSEAQCKAETHKFLERLNAAGLIA